MSAQGGGERRLPPVTQLGMTSLALIVTGGIYLAATCPNTCQSRRR